MSIIKTNKTNASNTTRISMTAVNNKTSASASNTRVITALRAKGKRKLTVKVNVIVGSVPSAVRNVPLSTQIMAVAPPKEEE